MPMMKLVRGSLPLARVFGVDVRLHGLSFGFLAFYLLIPSLDKQNLAGPLWAAGLLGLILLTLLLHELAHLIAARAVGTLPRLVLLLPICGVPVRDPDDNPRLDRRSETIIALAGPWMSLLVAGITAGVIYLTVPNASLVGKPWLMPEHPGKTFFWLNLLLGLGHLAPAYPLDGGRILRAILASGEGDGEASFAEARRRVVNISQVFAIFLMFAGAFSTPALMLVGFLLFLAVQVEDRSLIFESVIESVRLGEVMLTDFATLSPADTLHDALHKAVHTLQDDFPVIRGNDLVGVISRQHIVQALHEDGDGYVQSAMKKAFEVASRNDTLSAAFRKLSTRNATVVPVVDDGRLVGIVTLQNLMHSMGLLAESRKLRRVAEE